jgi:hypothetical protein
MKYRLHINNLTVIAKYVIFLAVVSVTPALHF